EMAGVVACPVGAMIDELHARPLAARAPLARADRGLGVGRQQPRYGQAFEEGGGRTHQSLPMDWSKRRSSNLSVSTSAALPSKLSCTRWRMTGRSTARRAATETWLRPAIKAWALPATTSDCAPRGLTPKRTYFATSLSADGSSGCVARQKRAMASWI